MSYLGQILREQIQLSGPMTWHHFMKQALYHPEHGYYEKEGLQIGPSGDFVTNACLGPLFGRLLAARFAAWLENFSGGPLDLVEVAAHRGDLARDILEALRAWPTGLWDRLHYRILEPSQVRRTWQQSTLENLVKEGKVSWMEGWEDAFPGAARIHGVVFCNEFLDALPVRRFGWDRSRRTWFEWGVDWQGQAFAWTRLEETENSHLFRTYCDGLGIDWNGQLAECLPDGYTLEWCPEAVPWWREAAERLGRGYLLTFDYGYDTAGWLSPERVEGTLRGYRHQKVSEDVLADPGSQDLTAHVHFTALRKAGEQAGLTTLHDETQERFLTPIIAGLWQDRRDWVEAVPGWVRQFQALTHPEHMGRPFRVLVQQRT